MRIFIPLALTSLAATACTVQGGGGQTAEAETDSGTTVRIAGDGAQVDSQGAGIRVGHNGIEIDLDRDVELNVGELRARVRPGNDGSLAVTLNSQ
ncbi:hypothetical protein [Sphingosinicella terrae]|uniref:hypothetical protein n=1 Tax=Sphingosinicella terrae TaxID=2172047 RepID=UPI000E0DA8D0|nr:hypothetical protein [Sphingosinicella terrae]